MKKSLLALAVLGAFAGAASAQSSVTLFGVVDVGVQSIKNGDWSQKKVSTDGLSSSRLGVRGTEDLGGGLAAGFWLESAVNPDNGTTNATRFWHRRSTVSLSSKTLGELRLGRDLTPTFTGYADFDPFNTNGVGALNSLHSFKAVGAPATDTLVRADNQVQYFLPANLGGVYGSVTAAPAEGVAGTKYGAARLGYAVGPINVSVSSGQTAVDLVTKNKFKESTLAGSYDAGVAKVSLIVSQDKYLTAKATLSTLGVIAPVSAAGRVRFAYTAINAAGTIGTTNIDKNDAKEVVLGYVQDLSKRTSVYGTYAQIDNKNTGTSALVVGTGGNGTAPAVAGKKSTGVEFGIKHSF